MPGLIDSHLYSKEGTYHNNGKQQYKLPSLVHCKATLQPSVSGIEIFKGIAYNT